MASGMFVFCSNDYNPFADPANARAIVKYKSFNDVDTTSIFSTETLQVVVSGRDLVDSFSIAAPANRFFKDSTVRARPAPAIPPTVFTFFMSFIDTGWQDVSVSTFRKNNEKVSVDFSLFCTSPLRQNDINATYDDSIVLSTKPVADAGVLYHWDFGNGLIVEKAVPSLEILIKSLLSGKQGALWVSDNMGKNNSPKSPFSFTIRDTSGPAIVCVNDSVRNDTIQTSDSTFTFLARIRDLQDALIASASVNGQPFDFIDNSQKVYLKIFYGAAAYPSSSPLFLHIKATDIFGNLSEKVFTMVYNAAIGHHGGLVMLVKSPTLDTSNAGTSSTQRKVLFGTLENYSTAPFATVMRLRVNGVPQAGADTLSALPSVQWYFNSALALGANRLTVTAFRLNGDSCAGASFTLTYDTTAKTKDVSPPVILDISAAGAQEFFTVKDSLVLRIIAVDEGTGIRTLSVNGKSIASSTEGNGYIWYDTIKTYHGGTQDATLITVTDSVGNAVDTQVVVCKNNLPQILSPPFHSSLLIAGITYRDTVDAMDFDYDNVQINKISGPAGITVLPNGNITWAPSAADTGRQTLTLGMVDGYQSTTYSCTLIVVALTGTKAPPVRFLTTARDFPYYLQAGKDPLAISLQTVNGTPPLEYSALVMNTGAVIPMQDGVVRWAPAPADTGLADLMIIVTDRMEKSDTLRPVIVVLPPNRPFTLSVSYTAALTADSSLDMSTAAGPDTLRFSIHDPDVPLVEQHTVRIVQSHTETVSAVDSSRAFMIILDPARVSASVLKDTIQVIVTDRGGHADSLLLGVVYHTVPALKKIWMNTTSGNGAGVLASVLKFPVLVRLDKTNFDFSVVNNTGSPVGFKKSDGALLPFEIERWDSGSGQAEIWVLVDTIFGNDSTHSIIMSWDANGPAPQSNGPAVFDTSNGFVGVWHMNENPGAGANSIKDRTVNSFNATPNGAINAITATVDGAIGKALNFNGTNGYCDAGTVNLAASYSVGLWVKPSALNSYQRFICKDLGYTLWFDSDRNGARMEHYGATAWRGIPQNGGVVQPMITGTWYYLTGTYDGNNIRLYANGALKTTTGVIGTNPQMNTGSLMFGKASFNSTDFVNGTMDEIRIEKNARSADWIKLCYENQRPGSTFIVIK